MRNLKHNLESHFGDKFSIVSRKGDLEVCHLIKYKNELKKDCHTKKNPTEEERIRIVEAAARIILEDIRAKDDNTSIYKSPSDLKENAIKDVPHSLLTFLEVLIKTYKQTKTESSQTKLDNKILTAANVLISSVRPKSFISPILLGLSVMMHRKYASRALIDCLSNIGLSASYYETALFEAFVIKNPKNLEISGSNPFVQFIYDNADHNTRTIDGNNTLHAMGTVMAVTPASAVSKLSDYDRLKKLPPAKEIAESFPFLPVIKLNFNLNGFSKIQMQEIDFDNCTFDLTAIDFLWLYTKNTAPLNTKGWMGYRETQSSNLEYQVSKINPLQFINAPPSDYDTIFTSLIEAARRGRFLKMLHIF